MRRALLLPYRMLTQLRFDYYYNPEYFTWPFLAALIGILFIRPKIPWVIYFLAAFSLLSAALLSPYHLFWRYYFPALPGLSLIFSWTLSVLFGRKKKIFLIGTLLLMLLAVVRLDEEKQLLPVFGFTVPGTKSTHPEESYLEAMLPHYRLYQYVHGNLSQEAKILLFDQNDFFHLKREAISADPLWQGLIRFEEIETAEELLAKLKELKITHIVTGLVSGINPTIQYPDWYWKGFRLLEELIAKYTYLLYEINQGRLYQIK